MKGLILFFVIVSFLLFFGCTNVESEDNSLEVEELKEQLSIKQNEFEKANLQIIVLQENEKYLRNEVDVARNKRDGLQEVYNSLVLDWQNCYASDLCAYYPITCINWVEESFGVTGFTADELHKYYSLECEKSDRDWDKYSSFYTGE
jgi:hypothetical protein